MKGRLVFNNSLGSCSICYLSARQERLHRRNVTKKEEGGSWLPKIVRTNFTVVRDPKTPNVNQLLSGFPPFVVCIINTTMSSSYESINKQSKLSKSCSCPNLVSCLWSGIVGWDNAKPPKPRDSRLTYPCWCPGGCSSAFYQHRTTSTNKPRFSNYILCMWPRCHARLVISLTGG